MILKVKCLAIMTLVAKGETCRPQDTISVETYGGDSIGCFVAGEPGAVYNIDRITSKEQSGHYKQHLKTSIRILKLRHVCFLNGQ